MNSHWCKAQAFQLYYNAVRLNYSKGKRSPLEIIATDRPYLTKKVILFPVINIDDLVLAYLSRDSPTGGQVLTALPARDKSRKYCYTSPSKRVTQKAKDRIRELTAQTRGNLPVAKVVEQLNAYLRGWNNYFSVGYPSKVHQNLNNFVGMRLARHLRRRSQKGYRGDQRSWYAHFMRLGLHRLRKGKNCCMPKVTLSRKAVCVNSACTV